MRGMWLSGSEKHTDYLLLLVEIARISLQCRFFESSKSEVTVRCYLARALWEGHPGTGAHPVLWRERVRTRARVRERENEWEGSLLWNLNRSSLGREGKDLQLLYFITLGCEQMAAAKYVIKLSQSRTLFVASQSLLFKRAPCSGSLRCVEMGKYSEYFLPTMIYFRNVLCQVCDWQIFLPVCGFSVSVGLYIYDFDEVLFFLSWIMILVLCLTTLCLTVGQKYFLMFSFKV